MRVVQQPEIVHTATGERRATLTRFLPVQPILAHPPVPPLPKVLV
jgi:hypothetical protein